MPMLRMDTAEVFDYITYDPHDRVRGHHYHQSGGQSRTAYIIAQRREIEKLRAAGVDVDADIKEAALWLFIRKSVADPYYHHHDRAGLTPVHDELSHAPGPQLAREVETDKQQIKSSPGVGGAQQLFTLTTITQNLKERAQMMINPTPRGASVRPEDRCLDELDAMVAWCGEHGFDLCLIETMPMGDIDGDRTDQYLPLSMVRAKLRKTWTLEDTDYQTGGPARYFTVAQTGARIGFITPMTHNFCESCNRVRLTCTGQLYLCLGQEDSADLRAVLRASPDDAVLAAAVVEAITRKPKGHDFIIDRRTKRPAVGRHMSVTGG